MDIRDMDSDLAEVMSGPSAPPAVDLSDIRSRFASAVKPPDEYKQPCIKCHGTGVFTTYTGRSLGSCFACNGAGFKSYRTAPEVRARARESTENRKAQASADALEAFKASYPAEWTWLHREDGRFDFATQMVAAIAKYGALTERQLETVSRLTLRTAERDAQRAIERAQRESTAPAADVSKIESAFEVAREKGLKRIGVRLATFKFKPAPATGKNPGAVYVQDVQGEYLGKVLNGRLFRSRECSEERAAEIVAAAADPLAAAIAYGKEFGTCAICSRELSDPKSVALGIGPICADKYGW